MVQKNINSLLSPQSVAVIGASAKKGKVGYEIVMNLKNSGFEGSIVPVNPHKTPIGGMQTYPDLISYNNKIDLSIIVIPAPKVYQAVKDSVDAGATSICIISAGFKETGKEGAKMEQEIAQYCQRHRVYLVGPNCLGLINSHHKMNASFAKHMPSPGAISVISQSGALCTAILDWASQCRVGLAHLISMGNKADLGEEEFIELFTYNNDTKVIVGYLESVSEGEKFIKTAERASNSKPVILLKAGITNAGSKAASSHTGSLAGANVAYGSAFKRAGIIRAATFEQLFDFGMAFAMQPLPKGKSVAIITNAGGPGIMAADAAEQADLDVCILDNASATALRKKLPASASVGNPIDVLGDADPKRYHLALSTAIADDSVDAVVVILTPQAMTRPAETAQAIAECSNSSKPILVSFMGGLDVESGRNKLIASNIPDYPSPERAINALKAMYTYSKWRQRPSRIISRFAVNRRRVERIIQRDLKRGIYNIGEAEAKSVLAAYGFTILPGKLACSADEASNLAEKIGFPIAMKIASPEIIHKSDVGGVVLDLSTVQQVNDAYDLMVLRIGQKFPNITLEGVYIERMSSRGREVILGMNRDPQFGPMLMFGLGGIFVEVMKDVSFHIAPITEEDAMHMIENTRSIDLLKGARGQDPYDLRAIANALQRMSQLVTDFPQIAEMDINPFIVGRAGQESVAVDARISLIK